VAPSPISLILLVAVMRLQWRFCDTNAEKISEMVFIAHNHVAVEEIKACPSSLCSHCDAAVHVSEYVHSSQLQEVQWYGWRSRAPHDFIREINYSFRS
jgi:hypothetical protein